MSSDTPGYGWFVRGTAFVFVGNLLGMGLAFLTRVVAGRVLSPTEYGLLVLGVTVLNSIESIGHLGLYEGLARELPRSEESEHLFTSGFVISIASSLLFTLLLAGGVLLALERTLIGADTALVVLTFVAGIVPMVVFRVLIAGFRGRQDAAGRVLVQNVLYRVLVIGALLGAFLVEPTPFTGSVGWVAGLSVATLAGLVLLQRRQRLVASPVSWRRALGRHGRRLLRFSLPLMVAGSVWILLQQVDNLFLAVLRTKRDVGLYDAAFTIGRLTLVVVWPMRFIALPIFSDLSHRESERELGFRQLYHLAMKWVVTTTLPLFVFLGVFAPDIIRHVFGVEYGAGATSLLILAGGFFASTLVGLPRQAQTAVGNVQLVLRSALGALAANVLLNVTLIPRFGQSGAAVATAVSYLFLNLFLAQRLSAATDVSLLSARTLRSNGPGAVVLTSSFGAVAWIGSPSIFVLAVTGIVGCVLHSVAFLLSGGIGPADLALLDRLDSRTDIDLSYLLDRLRPYVSSE